MDDDDDDFGEEDEEEEEERRLAERGDEIGNSSIDNFNKALLLQGNWIEEGTGVLWTISSDGNVLRDAEFSSPPFDVSEDGSVALMDGYMLDADSSDKSHLVWKLSGEPAKVWTSAKKACGQQEKWNDKDGEDVVFLQLNDSQARDLRPILQKLPIFGFTLIVMYVAFWGVILATPFTLEAEMTCDTGVPRSSNFLFGGICFALTLAELMIAALSPRGQRLLRNRGKTVFLVILGMACRFDPYGDVSFISIARKCNSEWWKYATGVFLFGVVILQTLPGFYYMIRFVLYQEDPYKALTYSDFHILLESIDPEDVMVEIPTALAKTKSPSVKVSNQSDQVAVSSDKGDGRYKPLLGDDPTDDVQITVQEAHASQETEDHGGFEDPQDDYDQDEHEKEQFRLKMEAQAHAEHQLKDSLVSRNTSALFSAIEAANACDYKGNPLTAALQILDAETKMAHLVGDVKRFIGTIRFVFEDCCQGGIQGAYLYENWDNIAFVNKSFTMASIAAGLFVSVSNPIRAWLTKRSAQKHLEMRIQTEMQTAMNTGDSSVIEGCCRTVSTMISKNSLLRERIDAALEELPDPKLSQDSLKISEANVRVAQILNGEGRSLTVESLKRKWASMQGFYHLLDAYPAGLLVLVRLQDDEVIGEVVLHAGASQTDLKDQRVPLFKIRFVKSDGLDCDAQEDMTCMDLPVEHVSLASAAPEVLIELPEGKQYFHSGDVFAGTLNPDHYPQFLTLKLDQAKLDKIRGIASVAELGKLWNIWGKGRQKDADLSPDGIRKMLASLLQAKSDSSLVLGMIRGPSVNRSSDPSVPHIKPGLYAGDYGEDNYGKFRRETALVQYHEIDLTSDRVMFRKMFRNDVPRPFDRLDAGAVQNGKITVVSGFKVTGDVHVPMGQVTWVALVQPSYSTLDLGQVGSPPTQVSDKYGKAWQVLRAWPGVGTLAAPGFFGSNHWDFGWLVMVGEGRSTRFAFSWGTNDAIILSWVKAQDKARYFEASKSDLRSLF